MTPSLTICIASGPARRDLEPLVEHILKSNIGEDLHFLVVFDGWEPPEYLITNLEKKSSFSYQINKVAQGHVFCRNLQASRAKTDLVAFLDDDLSKVFIPVAKISRFMEQNPHICAIRGRLSPSNKGRGTPSHWNLGSDINSSSIDLEGISVFRRQILIQKGGFHNPSGEGVAHEGIDLTWKIALEHGPRACAYYPLLYAKHPVRSPNLSKRKESRPKLEGPVKVSPGDVNLLYSALRREEFKIGVEKRLTYAVLTTSANSRKWADDYLVQLEKQTAMPDEIVFVSDETHLLAGFEQRLKDLGIKKTKLLKTGKRGRSEALNLGMENVESDVVLVWDVDDLYFPYRIAWTIWQFEKNGNEDLDFLSGSMIKEGSSETRWPHKPVPSREGLLANLLHSRVPCPFPAVAFRRSSSPEAFRLSAKAAVDVHWYVDNLKHWRQARIEPEPLVFYRKSRGQMSSRFALSQSNEKQKAVDRLRQQFTQSLTDVYFKNSMKTVDSKPIEALFTDSTSVNISPETEELLGSLSWKITSPLRKLEDKLNLIPFLLKIGAFLPKNGRQLK